ncbi:hypothetical protein [Mesorhizobium sp.]|uniref:hypothetical protein n=1 Tax=Mesorhizobium sp. TaxID=1871066 RepID=UPI0025797EF9|nr:hypothetical protein [Mesorhizobium sp.]
MRLAFDLIHTFRAMTFVKAEFAAMVELLSVEKMPRDRYMEAVSLVMLLLSK